MFFEFAGVNYNAMLSQVSTPRSIGRVSGFGWGMGYIGGIVLLLVVVLRLHPGPVRRPERTVCLSASHAGLARCGSACSPSRSVRRARDRGAGVKREKVSFFASYARLGRDIAKLWRESRPTVWFLIASAVFRDGLAGVFTFGGVLAAPVFGFTAGEVIIFGIAAEPRRRRIDDRGRRLDDRFGAKPVIVAALIGLIIAGLLVFFLRDGGQERVLDRRHRPRCLFVGPAQRRRAHSSHASPRGREGEIFGLYATTGRAVSSSHRCCGSRSSSRPSARRYYGILGIVLVLRSARPAHPREGRPRERLHD